MQHVVKEANACVDADGLRLACLRGVAVFAEEAAVCFWRESPAIEVEGELDLGLVGVARKGSPARRMCRSHCNVVPMCCLVVRIAPLGLGRQHFRNNGQ
jgi:hypothetical protein